MFSKESKGDFFVEKISKIQGYLTNFRHTTKITELLTNYKTILYSFMLLLCFIVCKVTGKSHNCIMLFNCKAREYFDLSFFFVQQTLDSYQYCSSNN